VVGKRLLWVGMLVGMSFGAFAQAPAPSPAQREAGPSGWRALGSMVLVLGLAGGGLYAFRRWGAGKFPGSGGNRLRVEETLALGDRRFVSILKVDDERFLIALSPANVTLMTRLDNVEAGGPQDFAEALGRQTELPAPMAVRDMEAMIRREQR